MGVFLKFVFYLREGILSNISDSGSQSGQIAQLRHIPGKYTQNGGTQYRYTIIGSHVFKWDLRKDGKWNL